MYPADQTKRLQKVTADLLSAVKEHPPRERELEELRGRIALS